jgi:PAT family beta-lactamase induction signal transducer AmpG
MLTGNGLIVIIGGYLNNNIYKQKAWSYTMIIVGLLMAIITLYNYFTAPRTETSIAANANSEGSKKNFQFFLVSSKRNK